jgi:hypothetical protein
MVEILAQKKFQKKFRDLTLEYQKGYFKSKIKKKNQPTVKIQHGFLFS